MNRAMKTVQSLDKRKVNFLLDLKKLMRRQLPLVKALSFLIAFIDDQYLNVD